MVNYLAQTGTAVDKEKAHVRWAYFNAILVFYILSRVSP